MITVPDRLDSGLPPGNDKSLIKTVRKVVVIQIRSRLCYESRGSEDDDAYIERDVDNGGTNAGQVLCTKVVDAKEGRVAFWFIRRDAGKNVGFEFPYLQGAVAAIVLMELSDHETIQETKELLREICRVFPIPVMLVVGGNMREDLTRWETPVGLGEVASKVVSFADAGRKAAVPAS